jgi:hypothetical protein
MCASEKEVDEGICVYDLAIKVPSLASLFAWFQMQIVRDFGLYTN